MLCSEYAPKGHCRILPSLGFRVPYRLATVGLDRWYRFRRPRFLRRGWRAGRMARAAVSLEALMMMLLLQGTKRVRWCIRKPLMAAILPNFCMLKQCRRGPRGAKRFPFSPTNASLASPEVAAQQRSVYMNHDIAQSRMIRQSILREGPYVILRARGGRMIVNRFHLWTHSR